MGYCPLLLVAVCLNVQLSSALAGDADAGADTAADQKLLQEIEAAVPAAAPEPAAGLPARAGNALTNLFNPALSANGLILATLASPPAGEARVRGDLELQELELQLTANVDPYFSANLILALPSGGSVEVEEGYLTATPQPAGIGFRAGKIKLPFGRENPLHTHALPFVEKSLIGTALFGDEGLNQVAVEASVLLPVPWYSALVVAGLDGRHQRLLGQPGDGALAGVAATRNVFDLWDDATLEAGLSYAAGMGTDREIAQAVGGQLTFKWRPARDAANSSAVLTVEAMGGRQPLAAYDVATEVPTPHDPIGLYAFAQWQLTKGWYVGARYEYLTDRIVQNEVTMRQSAIVVFAPTEFSAFRLQGSVTELPGVAMPVLEAFLQANFTIGAHPAHSY